MSFTHLHVHSHYSLLDGLAKIGPLLDMCQELKMPSIALTDHGSMYGLVEFYREAKKRGIRPILGNEMYLAPNGMFQKRPNIDNKSYHLVLLVKNEEGYRNLVKLTTKAYLEGFYYKPRVDKELLKKHSQGLIALSACIVGEIPRTIINGHLDEAEKLALEYQEIFGAGNFYLEIQNHPNLPEQRIANDGIIKIARKNNIPLVATNDVHYIKPEDAEAQDVLMSIQMDKKMDDGNRLSMKENDFSLRPIERMVADFKDTPDAISNTQKIVQQCDFGFVLDTIQLPSFEVPKGETPDGVLEKTCRQELKTRYPDGTSKEIIERLDYELKIINKMGFASYFLIVCDFVDWAKEQGIGVGPGRGSAAGSLIAFLLGITEIDPLKYNLLFERFLNPERVSMPDIDLDFADDRRNEVIEYVAKKYGQNHVAQIITFGTMAARGSIRDVGRALDYPYIVCDQTAKMVPFGLSLKEAVYESQELHKAYESDPQIKRLIDMAMKLEGVVRHASTHAAGVVITKEPLDDMVPCQRSGKDDQTIVTQYEMHAIEQLGLLKMDFLGLKTLTIIQNALRQIKELVGKDIDLANIPMDDEETFKVFQEANTTGVFQLESNGMKRYLRELKPTQFEDIVAMVALYRPGPMEFIPDFIARKHGLKEVRYIHPLLEPILKNTYGVCVTGDSFVQEANPGGILRIDEAIGSSKQLYVQSWNGKSFVKKKIINKFINGIKNVYEIRLRTGKQIKATADHEFLTPDGWKKLKNLEKGDFIMTPKKLFSGIKKFNEDKLKVLAYLIADGALSNHNSCYLVNKDEKILNDFKKRANAFDNLKITFSEHIRGVKRANPSKKITTKYHQPNSLLEWMRELGLKDKKGGKKSVDKFIPKFVFELDNQCIAAFLATFWDCDGGISLKSAYLTAISKRIIYDLQTLLLKLGINSHIYRVEKYKNQRDEMIQSYRIIIYNLREFYNQIGHLMITDKKKRLAEYLKRPIEDCKEFVPRKPFLKKIIEYQKKYSISQRSLSNILKISRKGFFGKEGKIKNRLNLQVANKIAYFLKDKELINLCQNKHARWEDIASIRRKGKENVYDLEVEGTHNFIANNIIVHNCVYQEQLMRIARDLSLFTPAEADTLRKAVGKKIKKLLDEQAKKMIDGMIKNNISRQIAEKVWQMVEPFAGYGFNAAHATCYALIGYQTAYLKAHYPTEFMAAVMTSDQNDIERISFLVDECNQIGVKVLPPDINESNHDFTKAGDRIIRFGLKAVKNVGDNVVHAIVEERKTNGAFKSITDFLERVNSKDLNKKSLESLVKCGAFDAFGERNQLLNAVEMMLNLARESQKNKANGQISLFSDQPMVAPSFKLPSAPPAEKKELLGWEKELLGLYISEHPLKAYQKQLAGKTIKCQSISKNHAGARIKVGGIINRIKRINTRTGQPMLFVEIEDMTGRIEALVFPSVLAKNPDIWQEETIVLLGGRLSDRNDDLKILCDSVKVIE
ncbi:DNA polymerase III subunit alpha [Patescibacteria group bacterium]|nr:DNA polymerase III subunit alpha [Patescibacteria group bacterium]